MATQALAVARYIDDVEDQAPLLPTSAAAISSAPLFRRLLMAFACVAVLTVAAQSRQQEKDATVSAAQVSAAITETGIISLAGSHGKEDFELGGALLANVTQALVMDDTDSKKDDTMLAVRKGEVVYVHNVSKKSGWTFVFTKRNRKSGFVPSMVLNENSALVQRNYTPTQKNAKGAVEVIAGDRVWLTGIKESGKDWIYIVKPDKDAGLLSGFIPEWAVRSGANSSADNSENPANSTTSSAKEKTSTKKAASGDKKDKKEQK